MLTKALGALALVLGVAACTSNEKNEKAKQRLWGRETVPSEVETMAAQAIDTGLLDGDAKLRARVLGMGMDEVYLRFGFLRYDGVAKLELTRGSNRLAVEEHSTIEHGLHGDFHVVQTGPNDKPLREIVFHNSILFVANAGGKLRVQGVVDKQHKRVRDEAWEPLRVYTSYYGERLGLEMKGGATVAGRSAVEYAFKLLPGPELIPGAGTEGPKRPRTLEGTLLVDQKTAVPVGATLNGTLELPPAKDSEAEGGLLTISLEFEMKSVEGQELKPGEFIPTIRRHPTDLEPLAFLEGKTTTSTVIGGAKPTEPTKAPSIGTDAGTKPDAPPEPAGSEKPGASEPEAKKPEAKKPKKKGKKKKSRSP